MTDQIRSGSGATAGDDSPLGVVTAFHDAWTSGDVDSAVTHLAEDVLYQAPGETLTGREAVRAFLAGFVPMLTGAPDIDRFVDEQAGTVCLLYHPQTASTTTAPAAEWFTVENGLITRDLLVFDRLAYGPPPGAPTA